MYHFCSVQRNDYSDKGNFMSSSDYRVNDIPDVSNLKKEFRPQFPVYSSFQDGFVPTDISALDNIYWWKKRFPHYKSGPVEDIPFFDDTDSLDGYITGGVNKRDYTAAQLVNMLKAIAKARRQRQIRIAGKGLRFGISK
ncbi:uncharacterized protein [Parasteatoda tepidariorum]|uniref:uncharacterized protein isoform X2 n=1 Tax=Parasteatoda tepidariorum TaxID=114398 RepID=UPI001C71BFC9|nr:uncharacterized protein LOC107448270 isoform X2 [Parasteatoda tepidariorum]